MIVTVTPNPSLDRTLAIAAWRRGAVLRAEGGRVDPGGKGVNVSRALAAQGVATSAVLPVGGPAGAALGELLDRAGVPWLGVPIAGEVRTNLTVVEADGATTKLNEPGPALSGTDVEALLATAGRAARGASWVVGSGSLPPGASPQVYARLVRQARAAGIPVAVDASGAAFAAAVAAAPDLIKPNQHELSELMGVPLPTLGHVRRAAGDLVDAGIETVVVSLGAQGALLVRAELAVHAWAPVPIARPGSTVGAGDCLLAGVLAARLDGPDPAQWLARGVAWATAAVALPGSAVPGPAQVAGVKVELTCDPDLSRRVDG